MDKCPECGHRLSYGGTANRGVSACSNCGWYAEHTLSTSFAKVQHGKYYKEEPKKAPEHWGVPYGVNPYTR